jgi:hypothetical protein
MTELNVFGFSDAARRAADQINTHVAVHGWNVIGKWAAIRLSDGGSDGVMYDSKPDAVKHQLHEQQCAYVQIPPDGVTVSGMQSYLELHRKLYDAGMRLQDPERHTFVGPQMLIPAPDLSTFRHWS